MALVFVAGAWPSPRTFTYVGAQSAPCATRPRPRASSIRSGKAPSIPSPSPPSARPRRPTPPRPWASRSRRRIPRCLKCHAPLADKAPELKAEGVTCEVCHGPGSDYKKLNIMKDKAAAAKNGLILYGSPDGDQDAVPDLPRESPTASASISPPPGRRSSTRSRRNRLLRRFQPERTVRRLGSIDGSESFALLRRGGLRLRLPCRLPPRTQGRPPRPACLECHDHVSLPASVHATLACADCHPGSSRRERDAAPSGQEGHPAADCTASCHRGAARTRGPAEPGSPIPTASTAGPTSNGASAEVARCWDCHGKHNIKPVADPESTVNRRNIPLTCSRCHEDMAVVVKYNIHAEIALPGVSAERPRQGPLREGPRPVRGRLHRLPRGPRHPGRRAQPTSWPRSPATCGRCHGLVFDEYKDSIHGREALKGNIDVPALRGLPRRAHGRAAAAAEIPDVQGNIPDTCSACHARPEIMKKVRRPRGPDRDLHRQLPRHRHRVRRDRPRPAARAATASMTSGPPPIPSRRSTRPTCAQTCGQARLPPRDAGEDRHGQDPPGFGRAESSGGSLLRPEDPRLARLYSDRPSPSSGSSRVSSGERDG